MAQNPSLKRQIAGKAAWNETRSAKLADFFTLGYSGRRIEEIVTALTQNGVRTLVDIRRDPVSRFRPEMNKRNIDKLMADSGITYVHVPRLGVPRDIRSDAEKRASIWDWYDAHAIAPFADLDAFLKSFEPRAALMCTELDPHECHRHRMALALEARGLRTFDL